jgi:hypothetical protein
VSIFQSKAISMGLEDEARCRGVAEVIVACRTGTNLLQSFDKTSWRNNNIFLTLQILPYALVVM